MSKLKHPAALLLVALAAVAQPPARESSCEMCHSKAAAQHRTSIHQQAGLNCVDCHGGDPRDMRESAMSPAKGFRGKPTRADQPAFCADCHSRRDLMRPYGLPTDQWEEYQTSQHGRALAKGVTRVAVCGDCHGVHDIRPPDDPLSHVAAANVPATCGQCHGDEKLMKSLGVPTGQVEQYLNSVHGLALIQGKNEAAPNCATCHGSHAAAPPDTQRVDLVCQRCHPNTFKAFADSPHKVPSEKGRMKPCVACHGTHGIQHPTPDLLLSVCQPCHAGNQAVLGQAQRLHDEIDSAQRTYDESKAHAEAGHDTGLSRDDLEAAMNEARTALLQVATAQHSLRLRDVERHTVAIRAVHEKFTEADKEQRARFQVRVLILAYFWGFLAVSVIGLIGQRRRAERQRLLASGERR